MTVLWVGMMLFSAVYAACTGAVPAVAAAAAEGAAAAVQLALSMAGGLMFGALDDFLKEDFFRQHRTGTLTLMKPPDSEKRDGGEKTDREIPFEIFAVLETDANIIELFEPLGSERALAYAATHAKYYSDPKTTHILALTTCVDAVHTTRTVVLCALEGEME